MQAPDRPDICSPWKLAMMILLPTAGVSVRRSTNEELIAELQTALDQKYRGLLEAARKRWEQSFAGGDPSDACVSVHISSAGTGAVNR